MISPATVARGASPFRPDITAISTSRPTRPSSTTHLLSWRNASSTAGPKSAQSFTFETPIDEPARAGFTKCGSGPRAFAASSTASGLSSMSASRTTTCGVAGMPFCRKIDLVNSLSMQAADESTPLPTYLMPKMSSMPWMVPSSPNLPCRTGKTTSTVPSDWRCPLETRLSDFDPSKANSTVVPLSVTTGKG